jgi:hypothetical protein
MLHKGIKSEANFVRSCLKAKDGWEFSSNFFHLSTALQVDAALHVVGFNL